MDLFNNLLLGFGVAATWQNLLYCFSGVFMGTLIGVLPGLGPVTTVALLLPITFTLEPTSSLIMLAGIYYGAQYGGSTTAILVNLPGESSSVVTAIDGYKMARMGRAGPALGIAAIASFVAGTFATFVIAGFAPVLGSVALKFGAVEYFSLIVFGLVASIILAQGSVLKALAMVTLGLLLGLVGTDVTSGVDRYTLGFSELADGIGFVALSMALFGIGEVIINLQHGEQRSAGHMDRIDNILPSRADLKQSAPAIARGTLLGSVLGLLPGGGALLASFAAYTLESKVARAPRTFGQGDIRGVAAPEAANNAGAQTSFIPMITLGLPANPVMAMMIGAMMIQGITPGPQVMANQPQLVWGLIVSMWIGNLMLILLNLPLIRFWVTLLKVRYVYMFPAIILFCCIGAYSVHNSSFEVLVMAVLAFAGFIFVKLKCEPAPLILGFILGPMMEENLRRALLISRGDFSVFVSKPISLGFLIASLALLALITVPGVLKLRKTAMQE
jgi:putative tricarboxylic transport membrane protein